MDTGINFIQPEFLNILFFQQKNLVVFPYVDLKHLHALELFVPGYNIVDLESTAIHNLKEMLDFESNNTYSQNPTLYFIYNIDSEKIKEIIQYEDIRCVINTNENVSDLANGDSFIFFNKKNNQFLNYNNNDLDFENYLFNSSKSESILQDKILEVKSIGTQVFSEIIDNQDKAALSKILAKFDTKYWSKILIFIQSYYDINIPEITAIRDNCFTDQANNFSEEYEIIVSSNRSIGKEFIQLLHNFRSKKVNPANLELEELINPLKLYNYLRTHHWKNGIPKGFIRDWIQMKFSQYPLEESDKIDFEIILEKIGASSPQLKPQQNHTKKILEFSLTLTEDWDAYKEWLIRNIINLEKAVEKILESNNYNSINKLFDLIEDISEILTLCGIDTDY